MAARDPYAAFSKPASSGASQAPARAPAGSSVDTYEQRWKGKSPAEVRSIYERARESVVRNATTPEARNRALTRFDSDPRAQAMRRVAGLAPVSTRQGEVREVAKKTRQQAVRETARRVVEEKGPKTSQGKILAGVLGGVNTGMFGLPARAAAAISGVDNDLMQAYANEMGSQAPVTNILTSLASGGGVGGLIGRGVVRGAQHLASSATPAVQRVGNVLQNVTQLRQGQRVRNTAKISAAGAAGGAAQSAGEGTDIGTGTAIGAVGAPALVGAAKAARGGYRVARNALGREPVESVLSRYVETPIREIQARMARRQEEGLPSSIYEVLPLRDRELLDDAIARMPAGPRERLAEAVRNRTQNMVEETAGRMREILQPRSQQARTQMANDLAASRGVDAPTPADIQLAERASRSLMDMETLAANEARNIMRPHDARRAFDSVDHLVPHHPVQRGATVEMVESSPEISAMIRRAAGLLRNKNEPLTVREVTDIMSRLRRRVNGEDGDIAREALDHITNLLETELPEIAPAVQRMRTQWHARMSTMEGMREGARTRLRETAPPTRENRNAYETAPGTTGRMMGQTGQLERDLLTSPGQSFGALQDIASNPTAQRAIAQNVGHRTAEDVTRVAGMQTESARRLGRLASERGGDPSLEGGLLVQNLLMLSPDTLPVTKIRALARLVRGVGRIPERQADEVVQMLFSQNPTQISRAVRILHEAGPEGAAALRSIGASVGIGGALSGNRSEGVPGVEDAPVDTGEGGGVPPLEDGMDDFSGSEFDDDFSDDFADGGEWDEFSRLPTGRQVIESLFPGVEITEDIRDPQSDLGRANPGSHHNHTEGAVDVRPIPGMTFEEFIQKLKDEGHEILEARDEVNNPSGHATGPHWHVVIKT